jgi:predicted RNA-binding Zn ribbon-like protein
MVTEDKLAFRFDCGAVWLNLLATTGRRFSAEPVERLATLDLLTEWLAHCELTPALAPDQRDLERTWQIREAMRVLALAAVDEQAPPAEALTELSRLIEQHDDPVRLTGGDRLRREPPATTSVALARLARQAADQLSSSERHALRVCPEHDCRGVFIDPPGRRRWCPSPSCASRGRVRALRARRAETS